MVIEFRRIVKSILVALLFSTSSLLVQEVKGQANQQLLRDSLLSAARTVIDSAS